MVLGGEKAPALFQPTLDQLGRIGFFSRDEKLGTLLLMCVCIMGIQALIGGFRVLGDYVLASAGQRMVCRVRCGLFDFVQRQSLRFHQERASGDTLYRILTDTQSFHNLYAYGLAPALAALMTLAGVAVVVLSHYPSLTFALLLVALPLLALIGGLDRWVNRGSLRYHGSESAASNHVQENLQGIQVVQAFGREKEESDRFRRQARTSVKTYLRLQALESGYQVTIDLFLAGGVALVVWIAGSQALSGRMTPGGLVLLVSYLWTLYDPIASLAYVASSIQEAAGGVRRVFEILDEPEAIGDLPGAQALPAVCGGRVSFNDVWFSYSQAQQVLKGLTFGLEPGASVAILGVSGAGKTTLANLLLRFAEPTQGTLSIDGIDIRRCTIASLRERIAFVPQEPVLFQGTIRENLAFAKPPASDQDIERAAIAAGIHSQIMEMPEAYATRLGNRGARLSMGQKQRLAIARAFLRDAPILIMDEPTSSLDIETEAGILDALCTLMVGRTSILISHRLATAAITDRVIILRDGAIAEVGSYEELLGCSSLLKRMHLLSRLAIAGKSRSNPTNILRPLVHHQQ